MTTMPKATLPKSEETAYEDVRNALQTAAYMRGDLLGRAAFHDVRLQLEAIERLLRSALGKLEKLERSRP